MTDIAAGPTPSRTRTALVGVGALSLLGYALGVPFIVVRSPRTHEGYVILYGALFVLYLLAVRLALRRPTSDRATVSIILGFGLLFRLAVLPTPILLSSDLYRYLWDGRVQWSGTNPYRYVPTAEELKPLRDAAIYPRINRPTQPTVYPAGAEIVFALVAAVAPDSILGWRLFVLACEGLTVALILGLLRRMNVAGSAVIIYAWAPLAVFEGVQAGHVDFVMLPALLLALRWRQVGRMAAAGAALGLAVLIKLYPAVLLVAWWRRADRRFPAAFAGVLAAGYLLYLIPAGPAVVGFLPRYFGSAEDFNIGLRAFLTAPIEYVIGTGGREALGRSGIDVLQRVGYLDPQVPIEQLLSPDDERALRQALNMPSGDITTMVRRQLGHEIIRVLAMLALFSALAVTLVAIARRAAAGPASVFEATMAAVGAYLLLVPTAMHAWYAAWILPFLTVQPMAAWLWFTGAVALSYLKYAWDPVGLPLWVPLFEFVPVYGLLAWGWFHRGGRAGLSRSGPSDGDS